MATTTTFTFKDIKKNVFFFKVHHFKAEDLPHYITIIYPKSSETESFRVIENIYPHILINIVDFVGMYIF